jgi:tetratricopeptide (TPR) repeat protein
MKAFLAHSFAEVDKPVVAGVRQFVESAGIEVTTGERAQNRSVAQKVKERITAADLFIGLFTRDRLITTRGKISRLLHPRDDGAYTTSYWVIQESGFALGLDKQMVLLVEQGITAFPELQGDMEVVFFDRTSLERSFVRVNQMLEDIKNKATSPGATVPPPEFSGPEATDSAKNLKHEEESPGGERDEPLMRLMEAMYEKKDYREAQRIFEEEVAKTQERDDRLHWQTLVLRQSHALGDTTAFAKLVEMTEKYSESPISWEGLGRRYEDIAEFSRAYEYYSHAFKLYNLTQDSDRDAAIWCAQCAATCLAMNGKYPEAISSLEALAKRRELQSRIARLFRAMAQIARTAGMTEDFLVYGEAALDAAPLETELRFNVAYDYSHAGQNRLALLHYSKLTRTTTDSMATNNLGVCLREHKLPGKSISHFRVAAQMGQTIALGNLSHYYLDGGFLCDAEEQIQAAQRIVKEGAELHPRAASAIERISRIRKDEDGKEQKLLSDTERERIFRVRCARAMVTAQPSSNERLVGTWETSWGTVKIELDDSNGCFRIRHKYTVRVPTYGAGGGIVGIFGSVAPTQEDRHARVQGKVHGLSATYDVTISRKDTVGLSESENVYAARALAIIDETWQRIEIMERTTDDKVEFREWRRAMTEASTPQNKKLSAPSQEGDE